MVTRRGLMLTPIDSDRLVWITVRLSAIAAASAFLLGFGAGLAETPAWWVYWVFGAAFVLLAVLCHLAARRG